MWKKSICGLARQIASKYTALAWLQDLNNKANEVNRRLALMCKERNISFLSHDEIIDPSKRLNESKLHLNSKMVLKLIRDYLSNRKQRAEVNSAYSSWKDIFYGVPQRYILGPSFFNIYLCDLFYFGTRRHCKLCGWYCNFTSQLNCNDLYTCICIYL